MTTPTPRVPEKIRSLLRSSIERLAKGPSAHLWCGESEEYKRGYLEARQHHVGWLDTWVLGELRCVLAYLDGVNTVTEIVVFDEGKDYGL